MPGPLDGIKVLDFTWALAGPYGTMILADLGAEIWKVEAIQARDALRSAGPVVGGVNLYTFGINRGKKKLQVNLATDKGRELALALADAADVLAENFRPGVMDRLGLDYAEVSRRNPRIIYASTSGFGQDGPYSDRPALDPSVQALSGLVSITGHPDGPPARVGYSIGDMAGGIFTTVGILGALVERQTSGRGQRIDVSMLECQIALLENAFVRYFATGEEPGRMGTRHPLLTPVEAFPTADGWVMVAVTKEWEEFCAAIGAGHLTHDARFAAVQDRHRNHDLLEPLLRAIFETRTTEHWLGVLGSVCVVAPVNTIGQAAADPQLAAREAFVEVPAWTGQKFRVPNSPVRLSRTPAEVRGEDPPGGHTYALLRDVLGLDDSTIHSLLDEGVVGAPLAQATGAV